MIAGRVHRNGRVDHTNLAGGDRHHIALASPTEFGTELLGIAVPTIRQDRAVRNSLRSPAIDLFQADAPLLPERHRTGNPGLPAPFRVLRPGPGEIEISGKAEARGFPVRALARAKIEQVHHGLAIVHGPRDATVLARDPGAFPTLLDQGYIVEDDDPV
ncbi:MAG: hypothetical protein L3K03_07045 [Thermoplasmata archaeon]|nr:hypothetical protein [Thermoplasmata archaeon]